MILKGIAMRRRRCLFFRPAALPHFLLAALLLSALPAPADQPKPGDPEGEAQKARLAAMKRMASRYEIAAGKEGGTKLQLTGEPLLRWTNPERGGVTDGCLYLFLDNGRPQASLAIYPTQDGKAWNHEFVSLAEHELVAKKNERVVWAPDKPGVEFKPIAGAPAPAESAGLRLGQMRALVDRFTATVTFQGTKSALRRLAAPVYRYGDRKRDPLDGAVFAFVQGTDPELLLVLEARVGRGTPQWHYALARQTMWILEVDYEGRRVWSVEKWDRATSHPQQTYFDIPRQRDD
jgi:hypothetical protein